MVEQGRGRMLPPIPPPCVCCWDIKGDGWHREDAARGPRQLIAQPPPPHRRGQGWRAGVAPQIKASGRKGGRGSSMSGTDRSQAAGAVPDSDPGLAAVSSAYQRFEPRAYLRNNYAPPRGDLSCPDGVGPWKLRCLAQTFATGERGGKRDKNSSGNERGSTREPKVKLRGEIEEEEEQEPSRERREMRRGVPSGEHSELRGEVGKAERWEQAEERGCQAPEFPPT